jgi:sec-independent protein translocase protein TatA
MGTGLISPWHLAIFALVVLLLFGTKRLPEIGRSVGKGMREFKDSVSDKSDQPLALPAATDTPTRPEPGAREHDTVG